MPHQTRYTGNIDVSKLGSILVITTLYGWGNKKCDQQTSPAETTKTLTVPKKTKETGVWSKHSEVNIMEEVTLQPPGH